MRLTATHMLVGVSSPGAGDAVAVVSGGSVPAGADSAVSPRRAFVPSPLPCGECPYCRRALVAACRQMRTPITLERHRDVDVPDRFLTELTEAAWTDLSPATVAGAGLVAELLDATARSGLGPGDTAIWIGEEPWVSLGAAFSARRNCRTFTFSGGMPEAGTAPPSSTKSVGEPIVALNLVASPQDWRTTVAAAEAASGAGHGRPERRIFVYGASSSWAKAALNVAVPGATLAFRRGVPAELSGLDRLLATRILIGGGYHPDLIAEALALLARGEMDVSPAMRPVLLADLDNALASFSDGDDRRFPLVNVGC